MTASRDLTAAPTAQDADAVWARRTLGLFLVIHFVVWTVLPLFRTVPHVDSLEALLWGETGEWGTDKHPPVTGFLAITLYRLVGNSDLAVYLASQVCVLVAFIFIYKLLREFLPPERAVLAVMMLEGTRYYSYYSPFYNVNLPCLMFTPVVVYFFYQAMMRDKLWSWAAVGLFAGLAMLSKYSCVVILFSLGLYLVLTKKGRARLLRPGPWLALIVAVAVTYPHLAWLVQYDFGPLEYASEQTSTQYDSFASLVVGTIVKLVLEMLAILGTLVIFAVLYWTTPKNERRKERRIDLFLLYSGLLPYIIVFCIIIFGGLTWHSHWPYPYVGYFPALLVIRYPLELTPRRKKLAVTLVYVVMFLMGGLHFYRSAFYASPTYALDRNAFAAVIDEEWNKATEQPLSYVTGGWDYPCFAASFCAERPKTYFPGRSVWIDPEDVRRKGIMVLARDENVIESSRTAFPNLGETKTVVFQIENWFGRKKSFPINYAVALPEPPPSDTPPVNIAD